MLNAMTHKKGDKSDVFQDYIYYINSIINLDGDVLPSQIPFYPDEW